MATIYNSPIAYNATSFIYNDPGTIPSTPGNASFRRIATATLASRFKATAVANSRVRTSTTMKPR